MFAHDSLKHRSLMTNNKGCVFIFHKGLPHQNVVSDMRWKKIPSLVRWRPWFTEFFENKMFFKSYKFTFVWFKFKKPSAAFFCLLFSIEPCLPNYLMFFRQLLISDICSDLCLLIGDFENLFLTFQRRIIIICYAEFLARSSRCNPASERGGRVWNS